MKCPLFYAFIIQDRTTVTKDHLVAIRIDFNSIAFSKIALENFDGQRILDQSLDRSFQRPRAVNRVITLVGKQCFGLIGNIKDHFSARQVLTQPPELDLDNRLDFLAAQAVEDNNLIDSIQEFRLESVAQRRHDLPLHFLAVCASQILDILAAEIGGHNDNRVLSIDRPALTIGYAAVFEDLQQGVKHVWVTFFDLVEQHHRVGPTAHGFREISALFISDVARRGADQPGDGMLFHELGHIEANHSLFVVEQELSEGTAELGLADAGRAEENKRPDRTVLILQPGAGAADGIRNRVDCAILPYDPSLEPLFHLEELL